MTEVACEGNGKCNTDQRSFKAYLSRWMAAATKVAPFIHDEIMVKLRTSAKQAALQCSGGENGRSCGLKWTQGAAFDGDLGVGEQMSALEVVQAMLIDQVAGPVSNETGGTSVGNYGGGGTDTDTIDNPDKITTGGKVGASILTTVIVVGVVGGSWWMIS